MDASMRPYGLCLVNVGFFTHLKPQDAALWNLLMPEPKPAEEDIIQPHFTHVFILEGIIIRDNW